MGNVLLIKKQAGNYKAFAAIVITGLNSYNNYAACYKKKNN
jgi:uncharacterized short protein YbdD (DUF466 family)